jgi:hypothetical protein
MIEEASTDSTCRVSCSSRRIRRMGRRSVSCCVGPPKGRNRSRTASSNGERGQPTGGREGGITPRVHSIQEAESSLRAARRSVVLYPRQPKLQQAVRLPYKVHACWLPFYLHTSSPYTCDSTLSATPLSVAPAARPPPPPSCSWSHRTSSGCMTSATRPVRRSSDTRHVRHQQPDINI